MFRTGRLPPASTTIVVDSPSDRLAGRHREFLSIRHLGKLQARPSAAKSRRSRTLLERTPHRVRGRVEMLGAVDSAHRFRALRLEDRPDRRVGTGLDHGQVDRLCLDAYPAPALGIAYFTILDMTSFGPADRFDESAAAGGRWNFGISLKTRGDADLDTRSPIAVTPLWGCRSRF